MTNIWDDKMKRIFAAAPQDYVSWLLPGAHFVSKVSLELKTLTRTINTDSLYKVILNEKEVILQSSFRSAQTQQWRNASGSIMFWLPLNTIVRSTHTLFT